jgi:6-phosphogluconolactonase
MIEKERLFAGRERLAWHLASDVAAALRRLVETNGKATLAVSGGETPKLFFDKLSHMGLPWASVTVTLADERQVPETSQRSNARLVRAHLLKDKAAAARFVPLYENPAAAELPPFDIVILGMGSDGHTASFFPGGDNLATALDPRTTQRIVTMVAPGAGEPRLTFTLPVLTDTGYLVLHIEGAAKRKVLAMALKDGPAEVMPVRAVLRSKTPLTLYWCR